MGGIMKIEGSIALVTGANRGIGKAITTALLDRGVAKVYAAVRDVTTVPTDDPRLVPVQLDVTDPAQVRSVADKLGDVEIVVNNGTSGTPKSSRRQPTISSAGSTSRATSAAGRDSLRLPPDPTGNR
jgi:NAD(P)-dependent dehydrogenase (short-subunit alcohol dehydrogenase family)